MALDVRNLQVQIDAAVPTPTVSARKAVGGQLESEFAKLVSPPKPPTTRAVARPHQSPREAAELQGDSETEVPAVEDSLDPAAFDIDEETAAALVAQPLPFNTADATTATPEPTPVLPQGPSSEQVVQPLQQIVESGDDAAAKRVAVQQNPLPEPPDEKIGAVRIVASSSSPEDTRPQESPVASMALPAERPVWNLVIAGGRSVGVEQSDPQTAINRLSQMAQQLAPEGSSRVQMRLNPPDLGVLRVDMTVRHDVVSLRMHTVSAAARDMLTAQAGQLQESLSQQGLTLGRLEVTVVRHSNTDNQPGEQQPAPERERQNMRDGEQRQQQQQRRQRQPNRFDLGEDG